MRSLGDLRPADPAYMDTMVSAAVPQQTRTAGYELVVNSVIEKIAEKVTGINNCGQMTTYWLEQMPQSDAGYHVPTQTWFENNVECYKMNIQMLERAMLEAKTIRGQFLIPALNKVRGVVLS